MIAGAVVLVRPLSLCSVIFCHPPVLVAIREGAWERTPQNCRSYSLSLGKLMGRPVVLSASYPAGHSRPLTHHFQVAQTVARRQVVCATPDDAITSQRTWLATALTTAEETDGPGDAVVVHVCHDAQQRRESYVQRMEALLTRAKRGRHIAASDTTSLTDAFPAPSTKRRLSGGALGLVAKRLPEVDVLDTPAARSSNCDEFSLWRPLRRQTLS